MKRRVMTPWSGKSTSSKNNSSINSSIYKSWLCFVVKLQDLVWESDDWIQNYMNWYRLWLMWGLSYWFFLLFLIICEFYEISTIFMFLKPSPFSFSFCCFSCWRLQKIFTFCFTLDFFILFWMFFWDECVQYPLIFV